MWDVAVDNFKIKKVILSDKEIPELENSEIEVEAIGFIKNEKNKKEIARCNCCFFKDEDCDNIPECRKSYRSDNRDVFFERAQNQESNNTIAKKLINELKIKRSCEQCNRLIISNIEKDIGFCNFLSQQVICIKDENICEAFENKEH